MNEFEFIKTDGSINEALSDMPCAVIIADIGGEVLYTNPMADTWLGREAGDTRSFKALMSACIKADNDYESLIDKAIALPGTKLEGRYRFMGKDGRYYRHRATVKREGNRIILTFVDDTALETEQKKHFDSVLILMAFFVISCFWSVFVLCWYTAGRTIALGNMTKIIECIGLFVTVVILKKSSLTLSDLGLTVKHIGETVKNTLITALCMTAFFFAAKLFILKVKPDFFPADKPFWDWSQVNLSLVGYMMTAFIQEFLSRGCIQECFTRVIPSKNADLLAIAATSLFFTALHIQNGLYFSAGAGILSVLLGFFYKKDRHIYRVTVIHYLFGKLADFLHFV